MLRIGLIDIDGHNFPNLALMKISSFHKSFGDSVEWWTPLHWYDILYKSKVFSFSKDIADPMNADIIIKGGTGYAIDLVDGVEVYDASKDECLHDDIERMKPDYSIYPQYDYAVSLTSRGCPRNCNFCIVGKKEGLCSIKVADVEQYYEGQDVIEILDPNILACAQKDDLLDQYMDTGAKLSFNQGLDIRFMTGDDIERVNHMRLVRRGLHFAWDNPNENLEPMFKQFADAYRLKDKGTVYVLTNFGSTIEQDLHRIYTLRDLGYDPYVMIYDKQHAPKDVRRLQRWVNNKFVFKKCKNFDDYKR